MPPFSHRPLHAPLGPSLPAAGTLTHNAAWLRRGAPVGHRPALANHPVVDVRAGAAAGQAADGNDSAVPVCVLLLAGQGGRAHPGCQLGLGVLACSQECQWGRKRRAAGQLCSAAAASPLCWQRAACPLACLHSRRRRTRSPHTYEAPAAVRHVCLDSGASMPCRRIVTAAAPAMAGVSCSVSPSVTLVARPV